MLLYLQRPGAQRVAHIGNSMLDLILALSQTLQSSGADQSVEVKNICIYVKGARETKVVPDPDTATDMAGSVTIV